MALNFELQKQAIDPKVNLFAKLKARQAEKQEVDQYKQTPKGKSFLRKIGEDIVKPFAEVGTSVYNVGESLVNLAGGKTEKAAQSLEKTRDLPFVGKTKPAITGSERPGEFAKKVAGFGAEIGSTFVGGGGATSVAKAGLKGAIKEGAKIGVKTGLIAGGLGLGGRSMQEDKSTGEVLLNTTLGIAGGGVLGGVAGAGLPAVGAGVRKILAPVESKISKALREGIDKGIKPYFGNKVTANARNKYYKDAEKAFLTIFENKPKIADELGEEVAKLPSNRAEMLESLSKTKQAIYNKYHELALDAGEGGAKFDTKDIVSKLGEVTNSKKYSPEVRKYTEKLIDDISELTNEAPEVVEARIQDLNNSLTGFYEGRVSKAKAQVDASVAKSMREKLDNIIESATGGPYQALKNKYGALKTVEKDLTRQVALEARKNQKGLVDFTDIFTGGDLVAGVITGNPMLVTRGLAGRALKEYTKFLNNPNRAIKNAFEILDNPPADIKALLNKASSQIKNKAGLSIQDVSDDIVKSFKEEDIGIMETFIDTLRSKKITPEVETDARYLLDGIGVTPDKSNQQIATIFEELLQKWSKVGEPDFKTPAMGKIANTTDDLIKEAKKYKSAEEFVEEAMTKTTDDTMAHRPTFTGATADNISKGDMGAPDFYSRPKDYAYGGKEYTESIDVLESIKEKPNADITIYRASPKNELRTGDWITLSKEKARLESLTENVPIQKFKVKAKDIQFAGDDITEFGYYPQKEISQLTDIWNKANKK